MTNIDYRENNKWTVYIHINKINKKCYVGITGRRPEERWGYNGIGYKNKCTHFWSAIQKYGWDNFDHEIIANNLTKNEAESMEILLIELLNTCNSSCGYNMSKGGTGGNQKEIFGVKQYDLDANFIAEYESAAECARFLGIDRTHITKCCKHGGKTHGFMFCYAYDEINNPYRRSDQRDIYKFDLHGNLTEKYRTFKEAADKNNADFDRLRSATTKYKTHYYNGFIWLYQEDIDDLKIYIEKAKKYLGLD